MALRGAIYVWGTGALSVRNDRKGGSVGLERSALPGAKNYSVRRGAGVTIVSTIRGRRSSPSLGTLIPALLTHHHHHHQQQHQLGNLIFKISVEKSQGLSRDSERRSRHSCRAKNGNKENGNKDDADDEENVYDENGRDRNGFDKNGRDRFGRDKYGLDEEGLDRFGIPGDAILDGPITEPEYHTYIDRNTGEPSPTYGVRPPLPNAAFWGDDLETIKNSSPSFAMQAKKSARSSIVGDDESREEDADSSDTDSPPNTRPRRGSKRKNKTNSSTETEEAQSDEFSEEELANIAQLKSLRDKFKAEEEGGDYKSIAQVMKDSETEEKVTEEAAGIAKGEGDKEEEEDVSLGKLYGQTGFGDRGYALVSRDITTDDSEAEKPLTNDELWWNWQKPPADEKPWSAWQKRAGDSDTVMAAAMAETGQIKLFGEKPTIAEATLARARRRVFYNERIEAEEQRKQDIGALAYYKEWVKNYKEDTSKEAVQKHYQETGEEVGIQLLDMFAHQTAEEYRIMQGTDIRIRRDPLTMRMRPDQIKQVWGGDPVYPTVNYEQDPDSVADYRNENMHEPIPDIIEMLRESGRLITQEEVKAMLEREKIEDDELGVFDGLSGAVDIGEEDEDDIDEDEDEVDVDEQSQGQVSLSETTSGSKKSSPTKQGTFELDDVEEVDDDEGKDAPLIIDEDDVT